MRTFRNLFTFYPFPQGYNSVGNFPHIQAPSLICNKHLSFINKYLLLCGIIQNQTLFLMLRKITPLFTDPLFYVVLFLFILNLVQPFIADRAILYDSQLLTGPERMEPPYSFSDTARLTYSEFRELQKKQTFADNLRDNINRGNTGVGTNTPVIGFEKFEECFTCTTAIDYYETSKEKITNYYLVLPGYTLRDKEGRFFMRDGRPYLEYSIWDEVDTLPNGYTTRRGHYGYKPLPFRYSYLNKKQETEHRGRVLIPISAVVYRSFCIPVFILFVLLGLTWLYLSVVRPIKVLFRVSRGIVFTRQNVQQLFIAAWIWLCLPFAIVLLQLLFRGIFYQHITSDVQLMPWTTLREKQLWIIGGLVMLAIAKAFKKGLSLQHEQDLTI